MKLNDLLVDTTQNWSRFKPGTYWMAVGFEKTGKTTAFSTFSDKGEDGVLFLDLEQGVRVNNRIALQITSVYPPYQNSVVIPPIDRGLKDTNGNPIPSISIVEAIDILEEQWKDSGKTTVVLDTVDRLSDWCNELALQEIKAEEKLKKNPNEAILNAVLPEDIPYAQAYIRGRQKVLNIVYSICDIIKDNGLLILPTHLKKTVTITESREVIIKRVPKLPEGLASQLGYNAEAIVAIEVDNAGKHWADFRGYSEVIMGTRIEPLNGKKFQWDKAGKNTLYNVLTSVCKKAMEGGNESKKL